MQELHKPSVVVPEGIKPYPEAHEITAARTLARHYRSTVEFLPPRAGYKLKTPDFTMNGQEWELKSPIGSRNSIEQILKRASKQSPNVVLDIRRLSLYYKITEHS